MDERFQERTLSFQQLNMDKYPLEFLKNLHRKEEYSPEIDVNTIENDIKANYKNWKEKTSTSPQGQYLGLYKTWLNAPEEQGDKYIGITSSEYFTVVTKMMTMYYKHQSTVPRWLNVHNLLILKKDGVFKINRLGMIQKLKSEVNLQ